MRNIALILMYNGSAYHGWQVQKTEVTVAETLEKGLSMVCGEKITEHSLECFSYYGIDTCCVVKE